jgi:hypothetical protein
MSGAVVIGSGFVDGREVDSTGHGVDIFRNREIRL